MNFDELSMLEDEDVGHEDEKSSVNDEPYEFEYKGLTHQITEEEFEEGLKKLRSERNNKQNPIERKTKDDSIKTRISSDMDYDDMNESSLTETGQRVIESSAKDKNDDLSKETVDAVHNHVNNVFEKGGPEVHDYIGGLLTPDNDSGIMVEKEGDYLTVDGKKYTEEDVKEILAKEANLNAKEKEFKEGKKRLKQIETLMEYLLIKVKEYPDVYKEYEGVIRKHAKEIRDITVD